ncbi:MAG: tetratricopeptide repeat protein [Trichlorobacter sp.]|uniref:tetratricopeptide repeat protein n=1 Tax=Trichlorobacter sp. TaxID=2911007 RepID=UPI00256ACC25|nr:tetratricopeptide repeat protein [Trichlorobacter sp.]
MKISLPNIALVAAVAALAGQGQAFAEQPVQSVPEIRVDFEQDLFELAHTVFLANGNIREALSVAERAVKARPADKVWRKKAAQTSEWAGRPELALEHWFYLAEHGDSEGEQSVLRLSRALQEFPLRMKLLEQMVVQQVATVELLKEYLYVAEGMGMPQRAYDLLKSGTIRGVDPVWQLSEQARLAEQLGLPSDAIRAWQERARLKPLEANESLALASLWYGQGGTQQAWQALLMAEHTAPATATAFWRTYADLAWTLQENGASIKAAELLIKHGSATEADYQRLQELYGESDPQKAYGYALLGWKQLQRPVFLYAMVDTGLRSGKGRELALFFEKMKPDERNVLAQDARAWMAIAQVYRATANQSASLAAGRVAVQLAPSDSELLSIYLWLLVDMKQVAELRPLVRDWEGRVGALPELQEPLAAAMVLMGDTQRALRYYRVLAPKRQADPAWLASFGDILEQAGDAESAWKMRRRAMLLVQRQAQKNLADDETRSRLLTQTQLLLHLAPGDALSRRIRQVASDKRDDFGKELVIGWAMTTGQTDLARLWYWRHFARTIQRPEWARLGLALEENDRSTMADLLDGKLEQLPYRDAVEAAQRTGFIPLAQEHAWQRLQLNREDYLLDTQVRQLFGERAGYAAADLKLQDQSGVGMVASRLAFSQPLTSRYSLLAELTERQFSQLKSGVLRNLPDHDIGGSLTLTRRHERGHLALALGVRSGGLDSFATGSLEGEWQPWRDLQLGARLELNASADETAALSVAGVRDRLRVTGTATLTPKDTVSLELAAARYYDQGRGYLGQGQSVGIDLRHQFTRAWPDYGIRLYGGYSGYQADGAVGANIAALVPAETDPTASFFVPQSFGHLGLGVFLGQTWKTSYTRDWKPFAEADIDWNSNSNLGFSYGLGLVGPVFGFDQLMFELTQNSGQFGTSDLTTTIGISYRYFY